MADSKDSRPLPILGGSSSSQTFLLTLLAVGGLGGLGLGGAQYFRTPNDLGGKLDRVAESVAAVERKVDVLGSEAKSRDRIDDRERARIEEELKDLQRRVTTLENRRARTP